jgi:hypothetical protein
MRLIQYFAQSLGPNERPNPHHLRLLKAYHSRQLRLDHFIGSTDLNKFMQVVPRYQKGGLHR